jgi:hypothetical protein
MYHSLEIQNFNFEEDKKTTEQYLQKKKNQLVGDMNARARTIFIPVFCFCVFILTFFALQREIRPLPAKKLTPFSLEISFAMNSFRPRLNDGFRKTRSRSVLIAMVIRK